MRHVQRTVAQHNTECEVGLPHAAVEPRERLAHARARESLVVLVAWDGGVNKSNQDVESDACDVVGYIERGRRWLLYSATFERQPALSAAL